MKPLVIFIFILFLFGCKKNKTLSLQDKLNNGIEIEELVNEYHAESFIGKNGEGGIIFYLDTLNRVGLSALTIDLPETYQWGCTGLFISPGSWASPYGLGAVLTEDIANACLAQETAASVCYDLNANGFEDWYLPAEEEAIEMNRQIGFGAAEHSLNPANDNIGNFQAGHYWTSSQVSTHSAKAIEVDDYPSANYMYKVSFFRVRPIRMFTY